MITAEQNLFDLSYLEQMDDDNFLVEVVTLYLQDTHIDLGEMKRALNAGAIETVSLTAHKLKSSTGMLQANSLFTILEKIEAIAKTSEQKGELDQLVQTAQYEFDLLKAGLELHLQEIQMVA